jgi:hypothetical protein
MRFLDRGVMVCLLLLGTAATQSEAARVRFSGPPTVADRKVSWQWEPMADRDPYFQGNTILELGSTDAAPVPPPVRILKASPDGSILYGVGSDNRIYVWKSGSTTADLVLDAPPDSILDIDIHRSGVLILGGLKDGRVAYWDTRAGTGFDLYNSQRQACRFVRFLVQTADVNDRRYMTAGDEDTVRTWDSPGSPWRKISNSGYPVASVATTENGAYLTVGDPTGNVRVFQPLAGGPILQRLEGHHARVSGMIFSSDRKMLVSVDDTGKLIVWSTSSWAQTFELQLERAASAILGIRDPDGALVYTLDRTGYYQIFDGRDGRRYRAAQLLTSGEVRVAVFGASGRRLYLPLADGTIRNYQTGFCQPSLTQPDCFGGYMLWRSPSPRSEDATLLRVFGFGDSTWAFTGAERVFTDPDSLIPRSSHSEEPLAGPHNGLPYYYSITPFQRRYLNGGIFDVLLNSIDEGFYRADTLGSPTPVAAHDAAREGQPYLADIIVVPNPYEAGKVPWDQEGGEHVEFRNLPSTATIKIYTIAGEKVRTIEHGAGQFGESTDTRAWDLKNDRGEKVTSGVYIYHVTTSLNGETTTGYLCVVR